MRKDQVYFYTFAGLTMITFVIGYICMQVLMEYSTSHFLQSQIESSKREAQEISRLVHYQLEEGLSRQTVIRNLQASLEGTNTETGFVCMFDWSGVEICHPDPHKVGQKVLPGESFVQPVVYDELAVEDFYDLLKEKEEFGGIRDFSNERSSEIIYLYPVVGTDWIVAAHANITQIENRIAKLKSNFMVVFSLSGFLIVFLSFVTVRYIGGRYEKDLELHNKDLSRELILLTRLNQEASNSQSQKDDKDTGQDPEEQVGYKTRLMTYFKDEIVTIDVADIAYIYIHRSLTYIKCLKGKEYTSNQSLEELSGMLNESQFFRVNRQYILSIHAIDKIYKYGNHRLKITVRPEAKDDIIISKNKAAEFKEWLNS